MRQNKPRTDAGLWSSRDTFGNHFAEFNKWYAPLADFPPSPLPRLSAEALSGNVMMAGDRSQYSLAHMMVMTRLVCAGSAGSSAPYRMSRS